MKASKKQSHDQQYEQDRLRIIFEYSPIAIWEEDFSAIAKLKEKLIKLNVTDIRKYLQANPKIVADTFRNLRVIDVNKAALELYGAKTKAQLIARLGRTIHKSALNILTDEFATLLEGKRTFSAEFKSRTLAGKLYDVNLRVSVPEVYKDSFKRVIVTLQDISVQKTYERHLKRLAQTDGLTEVLNHNAIRYRLEEEFMRAKRYHLDLSCMMIDLNDFKKVNDTYGHPMGDRVLKKTAEMIKKHLREVDVVGRYGGDEFLVILPETPQESAKVAANRLKDLFDRLAVEDKRSHFCTISIGISGRPSEDVTCAKDMVTQADKLMYTTKKSGRDQKKPA